MNDWMTNLLQPTKLNNYVVVIAYECTPHSHDRSNFCVEKNGIL